MPDVRRFPRHRKSRSAPIQLLPLALLVFANAAPLFAQQAGGVAASVPQVRLLRGIVGAKGEQRNGGFVMTEPRSLFYVPDDREVIVYFVWEGVVGKHHCEGTVRGPNGQFANMSSFDYNAAQPRFAGYWKVPISDSTSSGTWIFETHVDGEPAGQVTYQVVPGAKPANIPVAPALPSTAEIYKLAVSSSVVIDSLDPGGKLIKRGSGVFFKPGFVATSFRVVEGASALRLRFSDGNELRVDRLAVWNRRQDWAIFPVDSSSASIVKLADAKSWNIGDHCYWLDVNPDGSRVIHDGQIVGMQSPPRSGDRINISGIYNRWSLGGPLLNEQGQMIGLLGGTFPDALLSDSGSDPQSNAPDLNMVALGGVAIAANVLPAVLHDSTRSLPEILASGDMMPMVSKQQMINFGMLSSGPASDPKQHKGVPHNWKSTFQRGDASAVVILAFTNNENLKSTVTIKLYDLDNHLVATGKPEKLVITRGQSAERTWTLPLAELPAGFYRVDILVADDIAWRQYFKVTD
ncbi:MAG TPA: serine protease [Candidatus Acidoferrum sp.]|nr:serine protease [Candidatus Acidoferrum sp.]